MGITLVNSAAIPGSSSGGTSAPINTTGANLFVVLGTQFTAGLPTVLDSKGNIWLLLYDYYDSGASVGCYGAYCLNPTSVGAGHTFIYNNGFSSACVMAFGGVGAFGTTVGNASGATGTSIQPGSLTPTANGALLVSGIMCNSNPTSNSYTVNLGFSIVDGQPYTSGVFFGSAGAYLIQATAAAVNPTFSWSGSASDINAGMAVFYPPNGHGISGNAGVGGATVSYSGTSSGSTTADGGGNYNISGLADGNYTITPTLTNFIFSPASRNATVSGSDITGVNFTAAETHGWSPMDCRNFATFPNFPIVQNDGSVFWTGQVSCNESIPTPTSNPNLPPTDSRVLEPENSRVNPITVTPD